MNQLKLASLAVLSVQTVHSLKVSKAFDDAEAKLIQLQQSRGPPLKLDNVMQSVHSLERAVKFHQDEEKYLNEIGSDLKKFWHQADESKKFVTLGDAVDTKVKQPTKEKANVQVKAKAPAKIEQAQSHQQQ